MMPLYRQTTERPRKPEFNVKLLTSAMINHLDWIKVIDFSLLLTSLLLLLGHAPIFYFHLIFVLLTLGAFYWRLYAFIWRIALTLSVVTAALVVYVFIGYVPPAELVEIPMLTTILILVFAIAWQRIRAEDGLRDANEELEQRVMARTAELSKEITEREKAEQILRESEERYRQLVHLSFEAIISHTDEKLIHLNPAAMKLLGIANVNDILSQSFLDFVHPDHTTALQAKWQAIQENAKGAPLSEEKLLRVDGDPVDVEIVTIPIMYQGQVALQTVIRDITIRKQMEQARLTERMSIARDLHDSLGQSLGYLHLKLDQLATLQTATSNPHEPVDLVHLCDVANDAYEQVRNLLAALRASNTEPFMAMLRTKARLVGKEGGLHVRVIEHGQESHLSPVLQQQILALCGEALTNVVKHAQATAIIVEIFWTEETLTITIEDDGCGFDPTAPQPANSYGLRIMQERAIHLDGFLSIQSQAQMGTQLLLQIPLLPGHRQ